MIKNFLKFLFIVLSVTFISKATFALTGKDISEKVSEWLLLENVSGEPIFSKNSVYKDCTDDIQITKAFNSYKTIKVSCSDKNGFNLFLRINQKKLEKKHQKKISVKTTRILKAKPKKIKTYISIKLKRALEKNKVIELNDIDLTISSKKSENSFFTSKRDLLGRKLKKNLKMGQLLHPRHLYEKFDIHIGDALSIVSYVGAVAVTVSGEAIDSGNLGDLIKVKNLRSGNIIKGYVNKNKKIRVFR